MVLRVVASLWAILLLVFFPVPENPNLEHELRLAVPHDGVLSRLLIQPWYRWDAVSYTRMAHEGYGDPSFYCFLPLYPLLAGVLGRLLWGEYLLAAILISNTATLISFALLEALFDQRVLFYLAVFPTSFYLIAPYTESLFLMLVLGAFWGARRQLWLVSGLCGALAILTRWQGIALIPALGWMYAEDWVLAHALGFRGRFGVLLAGGRPPLAAVRKLLAKHDDDTLAGVGPDRAHDDGDSALWGHFDHHPGE